MTLLAPTEFSAADKLEILQRLDRYRKWHSLDEKRYCLACGQLIDGHAIFVVGGTRGTGALRLICPSRGCHSIPMDWVLPTDEVLARMSVQSEPAPPAPQIGRRQNLADRLRKFATQFRRAA